MTKKKVLIATNPSIAEEIKNYLPDNNFSFINPANKKKNNDDFGIKEKPDLAVIDFDIDDSKINKLGNELKELGNPPLIVLFGALNSELVSRAHDFNIYAFLKKPVDKDEFIAAVELTTYKHIQHSTITEEEERYRLVSSITSDIRFSVSVFPNNKLALDWITPSFETHLGYSLDQIIKKQTIPEFACQNIHADHLKELIPVLNRLKDGAELNHEIIFYKRNGEACWLNLHLIPKINSKKQVVKIFGAAQDITKRKKTEISISELNNELESRVKERTAQLEVAVENLQKEIAERAAAEKKLKESEEQLNFAMDAVNDGIWDWRPVENYLYWSPTYLRMLGYSENEISSSLDAWKNLLHPDDLPKAEECLLKCINNESDEYNLECRFKTKTNEWLWILIRGKVLSRNDKNEILRMSGVHTNINERKISEEALAQQNNLIDQLLRTVPDIIYFKDINSRFLILSNSYLERFGFSSKEDLIGKTDFDLYTEEHAQDAFNDEQKIIATGNPLISKEEKEIWLTGEEHWVLTTKMPWRNAHGEIMGTFGISRDITAKKKAEFDLMKTIKEWKTTFDSVSDIVWILDKEFKIIRSNISTISILGKTPDEILGKNCWEAILGDPTPNANCPIGRMIKSLKREVLRTKINDKILSITADPILDENNNLIGAVQTISDATITFEAEEKVKNSENRLRTIVANAPGIISSLDINGIYTLSEGRSLYKLGLQPGEMVGKSAFELYKNYPKILDAIRTAYNGEVVKGLYIVENIYMETTFIPHKNSQGKVELLIVIANDVTEQKIAQQAVLQNQTLLKEAQRTANIGHYVFEINSNRWYNSEQLDAIFGIDDSFVKNIETWKSIIHPLDRDLMLHHLLVEVIQEHKTFDKEYRIIRNYDNAVRWVHGLGQLKLDENGNASEMFGTIQDITERKEAETQLLRTQFSMDKANDAIYWINKDGCFEYVNEAACKNLEYTYDELINLKIFDVDKRATLEGWQNWFDNMRIIKTIQLETEQTTKHGHIVPIEIVANYMLFAGKELVACFVRDISERKSVEEALRDSEERYKLIAENSADVIWILDIQQEKFTYISPSVKKLRGLTPEEVIAQPMKDAVTPQSYDLIQKLLALSIEGYSNGNRTNKTKTTEIDQFHKDGRIIPTEVVTSMIPNEQGIITHILGVSRDITERKKAEAQLQESEERYRLLVEHSPYAIAVHQNGKLVYVNQQAVKLQGAKSANELIGADALQIVHPESRAFAARRIQEASRTGEVQPIAEEKIIRLDGTVVDCELTSVPITLNGALAHQVLMRDITDIKRTNDQLKKLSRAVEESPAAIMITNAKGIIEYINPKFTEITGYTFNEAVGNTPRMLKSGEQSKDVYQYLWNTLNSGNEWRGEFHNKKKNGELYWEYDYITPIKNSNGEITNFVAIKEDITERKRLLHDIVKSKEEAEEANKVKSSLLANMSHEFRTPLNGILGFAQLLRDELKEEDHVMMLEKIHSSGKRLMNTLNAVLTLTELESEDHMIQYREFDLAFFCQEIKILYETLALTKNLKISVDLEIDYLPIVTDEGLLTKIVSNIVDNAIKYTPSGQIKIRLTTDIVEGNKNFAIISVTDTGIGIRKEDQAIIFKEFRQLSEGFRRDFEGLGLGLTIAKRMARLINADILVNSIYGVGSTFSVVLPIGIEETEIAEVPPQPAAATPGKVKSVPTEQLKILLVEDNPLNVEVVQRFLSKAGKVLAARDGITAIKLAAEHEFDLLLIDINLGHGIDGSEVLKQLRKMDKYRHTPSIALTGYASETNKREFLGQGFTSYLAKPFEKKTLLKLIGDLV